MLLQIQIVINSICIMAILGKFAGENLQMDDRMFRDNAGNHTLKEWPSDTVDGWLRQRSLGTDSWWQRVLEVGTPVIERDLSGQTTMHFFWRDPEGHSAHSSTERVFIDINGVTDHHSTAPESLKRVAKSDVWHWSTPIESNWLGSYCSIPVSKGNLTPLFSGRR